MVNPSNSSRVSVNRSIFPLVLTALVVVFCCTAISNLFLTTTIDIGKELGQDAPLIAALAAGTPTIKKFSSNETMTMNRYKLGLARDPGDPLPARRQLSRLQSYRLHNRLMVVPEYKLLFCYVEKVGCSMFNQLLRLLRLYHPSVSPEEREWLAQSHFGRANPDHFNLTLRDLTRLVNDDTWTKAVFFRDPADRFLSGFKSKCGQADSDGGRHCRQTFGQTFSSKGEPRPILGGDVWSFHQTIELAKNASMRTFGNPHFKPAARFCGGLGASIDHYSFVHLLDKKTVATHIRTLLNHLGVESNLAEGLLKRVVKTGGILHPIDQNHFQEKFGLRVKGNISSSHSTTSSRLTAKDYFANPSMLQTLTQAYQMDYDMFQLEPPRFEDLH